MSRVLVIEDDDVIRGNVLELLEAEGFDAHGAVDGKAGVAAALSLAPDIVVCDITMPIMDGREVLRRLRDYPETAATPFVFLTARAEREDVRAGMALGADDYLTKPFTRCELLSCIRGRLARRAALEATLRRDEAPDADAPPRDTGLVVRSAALREVMDDARRAARTPLSVLLLGETGVGKDVIARAIHRASDRPDGPFMPLNCAALAETLIEGELFGHERGAFTGANASRPGLFEAATGGTVFLDEVGDLPPATQVKLLRVLEDRRVRRVGGRTFKSIDVRFLAATNRDLDADCASGRFRQDLYFRLAGLTLTVPPLRERRADIAPLAQRFADSLCHQLEREPIRFAPEAIACLEAYVWPGNVRELRNVVERSVALCPAPSLDVEHLPAKVREHEPPPASPDALRRRLREMEKQTIIEALEASGGNQTLAAKALGISRRTLVYRLDEFGLPRPRKK